MHTAPTASLSLSLHRSSILSIQYHVCITYVRCSVLHDPQQPQMLNFPAGQSSLSLFSYLPLVFNVYSVHDFMLGSIL